MGRRNIVHPQATAETSTPTGQNWTDTGGYGDGSLNTTSKGYNGRICVNGDLWQSPKYPVYVTNEGNCDLPPFLSYPKWIQDKLTTLYLDTYRDVIPGSWDVPRYESAETEASPHTPKWLPFTNQLDSTVANTVMIHFDYVGGYYYYAWYCCVNNIRKFTVHMNNQDYSLNEALEAGLIEPLILINRGGQGPINMINQVLNNGAGTQGEQRTYTGAQNCTQGWTYTGDQNCYWGGAFLTFVVKAGVTFDGIKTCKYGSPNNTRACVQAYAAPTSQLKFTLATV